MERNRSRPPGAGAAVSDTLPILTASSSSGQPTLVSCLLDMDGQAAAVLDTSECQNYRNRWTPEWTDAGTKA